MISARTRTLSPTHRPPGPQRGGVGTDWSHHQTTTGTISTERPAGERTRGTGTPAKSPRTLTKLETQGMENVGSRRRAAKTVRKGRLERARRRLPHQANHPRFSRRPTLNVGSLCSPHRYSLQPV